MLALTRFVLGHKRLVVVFWLVVTALGVLTVAGTTKRLTNSFAMPGRSFEVNQRIVQLYGNGGSQAPYVPVLTVPAGQRVTDPAVAAKVAAVLSAARQVPGVRIVDYASTHDPAFVTADGRSTFALVFTGPEDEASQGAAGAAIGRAVTAAAPPGWQVGVTGAQLLADGSSSSSKGTSLAVEAMIGSLGALIVLGFVFASFLAILPLLVGAVAVLGTFLLVGGLTEVSAVSQIVEFLIALIGLGVAIDFSLLVVSRWREERSRGADNAAAVTAAMNHAGRAVVFSGLTVAIGLLSMIVLPVPMLRSVGYAGVLVPLVSVAVAVTLLPVILATAGPRLDWPRLRTERTASRFWTRWAALVYRRRWVAAVAGLGILAALTVPVFGMHLGEPGSGSQATAGPAHDALATLTRGGVPSGLLNPIEVLTDGGPGQPEAVASRLRQVPAVHVAVAPVSADYRRGGTAVVTVLPTAESVQPSGLVTVHNVMDAVAGDPAVQGVGGGGPMLIDFNHAVYGNFPVMFVLIGLATFLLLARAFRSILLAAKAVVFNLISLAAAYGVLTWVWQDGHGSTALWGIPATGAITMWVPLMVFAFLFGLSMDYEVFILTRIREAYDATGSAEQAVTEGIGRTGRLVTSAAAILMLSFLSMSTGPQTDLKILATGLGAGILVDAVVIRCLLVPAMVALFGPLNWWLPTPLARLLRVRVRPVAVPHPTPELAAGLAAAG